MNGLVGFSKEVQRDPRTLFDHEDSEKVPADYKLERVPTEYYAAPWLRLSGSKTVSNKFRLYKIVCGILLEQPEWTTTVQ